MRTLSACSLVLACLFGPAAGADWSPHFFPTDPDQEVIALCAADGVLYAGGAFYSFGPITHSGLMRWDGQAWSPVGTGLTGEIRAIAADGRGNVYVSGKVSPVRGGTFYGMAIWNGSAWTFAAGTENSEGGWAIAASGGNAYYLPVGSREVHLWRDSGLHALGTVPGGSINAMQGTDSGLVVGGIFTRIGEIEAKNIARYTERGWERMGDGRAAEVHCLATMGDVLVAGGGTPDGAGIPMLARWDGAEWIDFERTPLLQGYVTTLAAGGGRLYAGGARAPAYAGEDPARYTWVAEWDGAAWRHIDDDVLNYDVRALAVRSGEVWAGGRFFHPMAQHLARWDGKAWGKAIPLQSQAPQGRATLLRAHGNRLFAAGKFAAPNGQGADSFSILAEWTGNGWEPRGSGFPTAEQYWMTSPSAIEPHGEDVYLSGTFSNHQEHDRLLRWSGAEWIPIASAPRITALAGTPEGLYAGGQFTSIGGVAARNIARWDGAAWHAVGGGLGYPVSALAWDGTALNAAEVNSALPSGTASQVSRFSGGQWTVLGASPAAPLFQGAIHVLAAKGGELWAVGEFTGSGLFNADGVAIWNGSAWRGAGEGFAGALDVAFSPAGNAYVTGPYQETSRGIAGWNGTGWQPLGDGLKNGYGGGSGGGRGRSLAFLGEDLFVAGDIAFAGGKPSVGMALWTSRPDKLGLPPRARTARGGKPAWRLFPDGRLRFVDPLRPGHGSDVLGRRLVDTGIIPVSPATEGP